MNTIDLSPLYRNSIGFDRMASLLDAALRNDPVSSGYPPYNIEARDENHYAITLAVAGFAQSELELSVENGVLTVRGDKPKEKEEQRKYLHQGIANRSFERKFNLAEYVEVTGAELNNGLLTISLVKEIPEAMKPRTITISSDQKTLAHDTSEAA
ncbi:molecular chaperone IbpA [Alteromonadaceae bacterium 2753L.S.0a.02]|nr:molecular chaperone IbpA [Alteromonadaceae bacterium 2753L.S.0a.02]